MGVKLYLSPATHSHEVWSIVGRRDHLEAKGLKVVDGDSLEDVCVHHRLHHLSLDFTEEEADVGVVLGQDDVAVGVDDKTVGFRVVTGLDTSFALGKPLK